MTNLMTLDGPRLPPAAGGKAQGLVVLLHGWGADGNDLIGLAPYLAEGLPKVAFASPHAPFPCDMAPAGRQWFSLQDRGAASMLAGLRLAASLLEGFLEEEQTRQGVTADRVALLGFSQGTMLGLHVALRRKVTPAALIGFSGAMIGAEQLPAEITARPRTLLVHGDADPVVPVAATHAAVSSLSALQVPVEVMIRPGLPHSIDEAGMKRALAILREVFVT